jgi:hypothetical protein
MQVEYLLISIDAKEIVLENLQSPSDPIAEELRLYQKVIKNTLAILIQILAPEIRRYLPPLPLPSRVVGRPPFSLLPREHIYYP